LGDAPFGYVNVFTSHLNVGFFHGAALPDPDRLLQGTGKFMRHVKLRPGTAIGLRRLRLRRMKFVREQFFLAAAAQNIKRLVRFLSKAPNPIFAAAA
jgi:hypothetical protein